MYKFIFLIIFIHSCSPSFAQADSVYYRDSSFTLYSNGIFEYFYMASNEWSFYTRGIWSAEGEGLFRLNSFPEYKCDILAAREYYDSSSSHYVVNVYDKDGNMIYCKTGNPSDFFLDDDTCAMHVVNFCSNYHVKNKKFNLFTFVVQMPIRPDAIYFDNWLFEITKDGLRTYYSEDELQ